MGAVWVALTDNARVGGIEEARTGKYGGKATTNSPRVVVAIAKKQYQNTQSTTGQVRYDQWPTKQGCFYYELNHNRCALLLHYLY